jgi:hypothetical protein
MEWANYNVVVSNIGMVGAYKTKEEALDVFNYYVELSRQSYGRASNESVTLFNLGTQDVEIEYIPDVVDGE